jgi:hypothetical protein
MVFDALQTAETQTPASVADVERLRAAAGDFPWQSVNAVGEGSEFRAESSRGDHASALSLEGVVVHGSVVPAVSRIAMRQATGFRSRDCTPRGSGTMYCRLKFASGSGAAEFSTWVSP